LQAGKFHLAVFGGNVFSGPGRLRWRRADDFRQLAATRREEDSLRILKGTIKKLKLFSFFAGS
jgi:hypothetical protein